VAAHEQKQHLPPFRCRFCNAIFSVLKFYKIHLNLHIQQQQRRQQNSSSRVPDINNKVHHHNNKQLKNKQGLQHFYTSSQQPQQQQQLFASPNAACNNNNNNHNNNNRPSSVQNSQQGLYSQHQFGAFAGAQQQFKSKKRKYNNSNHRQLGKFIQSGGAIERRCQLIVICRWIVKEIIVGGL